MRFEYRTEIVPMATQVMTEALNQFGQDGWEAIHCHPCMAVKSALEPHLQAPALYVVLRRKVLALAECVQ